MCTCWKNHQIPCCRVAMSKFTTCVTSLMSSPREQTCWWPTRGSLVTEYPKLPSKFALSSDLFIEKAIWYKVDIQLDWLVEGLSFHKNFDFKLWDLKDNEFYAEVHHPRLCKTIWFCLVSFPIPDTCIIYICIILYIICNIYICINYIWYIVYYVKMLYIIYNIYIYCI